MQRRDGGSPSKPTRLAATRPTNGPIGWAAASGGLSGSRCGCSRVGRPCAVDANDRRHRGRSSNVH